MAKNKYYVIWNGPHPGIYDNWAKCERVVKSFKGAHFKGFPDLNSAQAAYSMGYENFKSSTSIEKIRNMANVVKPLGAAIAVDAACSGNPGKMEYQGVFVETGTLLFKSIVFDDATNNIGEFLAIVHGLAYQKQNKLNYPIYSDSATAMAWVKAKKARTKLPQTAKNGYLFELIARAEYWLANNEITVPIIKWDTPQWGEIPADFGRK